MTTAGSAVPTVECLRCQTQVPDGNFCGLCGCEPQAIPGRSSVWLRHRVFGAAPGEGVLRPHLASTLFPHLPSGSRTPFRVVVVVGALGLLAAALLRLPSLGIAVGALGLPLLFGLYLRASGADRDMPRASLIFAALSGGLFGLLWVLVSGQVVARNYGVPMSVGLALHHLLGEGFAIPAAGMTLMVLPAVVIRLVRPGSRESLDGFMIGALGALAFTATATLTRLAPQITTGLIAHARPIKGLVVEAVLCGVTVPISAAAAGGMVGVALWYHRGRAHDRRVALVLALLAAAALLTHAAAGVLDIIGVPQLIMAAVHLTIAAAVLLGLRLSLQLALLHEAHDPIDEDRPLLCPHCEHVVPDMAFCPACGAATRASSQLSRRERREPQGSPGTAERIYPGYALPAATYPAPVIRRPRFAWLLGRWGVVVTAAAVALGGVAVVLTPKIAHYMCPPECGRPPSGMPVMALPRFAPQDNTFSVSYPAPGPVYQVTTGKNGVTARLIAGDGGVLQLFSEPAAGRAPRDISRAVLRRAYPDATIAYEIPNAMVGYQRGYGEIADDWPQSSTGTYGRTRIVVLSAVKNDLALIAFATGPYHAFGPDFGPGPPSGANLQIAQDMAKYVNSFQWSGDPAR